MNNAFENYLLDLGQLVKERAFRAKVEKEASTGTDQYEFELGRLMALHDIVSLMQQQAEAFGIELSALSLEDISPEEHLT